MLADDYGGGKEVVIISPLLAANATSLDPYCALSARKFI